MKRQPNAITWNGKTYALKAKVRCHLGEATISRLYEPTANEDCPRAMVDRGEGLDARIRNLILPLSNLELIEDAWEHVGDAAARVVNNLRVRKIA